MLRRKTDKNRVLIVDLEMEVQIRNMAKRCQVGYFF